MMTKELFFSQLERAALVTHNQPVTGAIVRYLAAELKKGDPHWWAKTCKAWEKRSFTAWTEAWGLFLTCLHYEALSDAANPMVRYFPSCGGTPEADPAPAVAAFLADPPDSFFERLRAGHRRSYVAERAALWLVPAMFYFHRRKLPYYLVEVNSGAGLNLAADVISPQPGFDSSLVAARIGLDPEPLLLGDINQRRWLTAAIPPENMDAIAKMDQAADLVLGRMSQDPAFVQLAPCAPAAAPKFIGKNIPVDEDVGLCVVNMGTTSRMTDAEYAAYKSGIEFLFKPWGERALWAEVENVRGELYSTTFQLRIHRLKDAGFPNFVAASVDFSAGNVHCDLEGAAEFLQVG
ncbi:MAG: DUF2332 family protein [Elusimicrobiota bacterium]|jgi:hypothetical protein